MTSGVVMIQRAGGVNLAKTNTAEFVAGGNTINRVYGARISFDQVKACGGSPGGAAASSQRAAGCRDSAAARINAQLPGDIRPSRPGDVLHMRQLHRRTCVRHSCP